MTPTTVAARTTIFRSSPDEPWFLDHRHRVLVKPKDRAAKDVDRRQGPRAQRLAVRASVGARWALEPLLALGALSVVVTCTQIGVRSQSPRTVGSTEVAEIGSARDSTLGRDPVGLDAGLVPGPTPPIGNDNSNGGTEHPGTLTKFREAFESLAAGQRGEPLRVVWFGDSHTAADYLPNAVRKRLSEKVVLGGPGYVSLGVTGYRHGMAKVWSEGSLEVSPHPPARRSREDDGVFGLGGTRVTLRDPSAYVAAKASIGTSPTPMRFELTYRLPADSDALRVTVGEQRFELTATSAGPLVAGGLRQHRFTASSESTIEIRSIRGRPQLFGILMETERPGLVIDTLGVNGARFGTLLAWQEETLAGLVEQRQPVLFVVAYGTNEVFDPEPVERHARKLEQVVERLRRGAPDAECLVVGPTDAGKGGEATHTRVVAIDTAERATAERVSCAYFSPFDLMATDGGFESWVRQEPPLALSDGIHLTARGYARLGEAIARLLLPMR
jgi:lysophospholipase L1-like esterase